MIWKLNASTFGRQILATNLFLVVIFGLSWEGLAQVGSARTDKAIASEVLVGTNEHRVRHGMPKLSSHPALTRAAELHSLEMANKNYFSHRSPTRGLEKVRQRVGAQDVTPKRVAENIASCYGFPPDQVADYSLTNWLESPGHRANISNPKYSHIGLGVAYIGDKYYVTQVFAGGDLNFEARVVGSDSSPTETSRQIIAKKIFELTNQRRRDAHLPEFAQDNFLEAAASSHSEEMLRMNYFSHRSPIAGRVKLRDRINNTGVDPFRVAENIYQCSGYKSETVALRAMLSWMQSEEHKRNILDSRLSNMGIGVYEKNGSFYVTQVFGGDD